MKKVSVVLVVFCMLMSLFAVGVSASETVLGMGDIDVKSETGVTIASGKAGKWAEGGYIGFNDVSNEM